MRSNLRKDIKVRKKYAVKEEKYRALRSIYFNGYFGEAVREIAQKELMTLGGNSTKIRNRCVITGRGRGVLRKFRVSRLVLKELGSAGKLVGIRKSSW